MNIPNLNRVRDLSIKITTSVTLYDKLLTLCHSNKNFELNGVLSKMIFFNYNNFDNNFLLDQNEVFEYAKEMFFDEKALGRKTNRDKTPGCLNHLVSRQGLANRKTSQSQKSRTQKKSRSTRLSSDPDEHCDRIILTLQEKEARKNPTKDIEETVTMAHKLLEHNCMSRKKHS